VTVRAIDRVGQSTKSEPYRALKIFGVSWRWWAKFYLFVFTVALVIALIADLVFNINTQSVAIFTVIATIALTILARRAFYNFQTFVKRRR